jgi:hypothetical protein
VVWAETPLVRRAAAELSFARCRVADGGMEYSFRPVGRICAATGVELNPGTVCRSALVERDGRFERLDYALSAWPGALQGTIGHWRCRIPAATTPPVRRLDPDELMQQFERLDDAGHEQVRRLRYVLTLLLLQRKRMSLEDCRSEDDVNWLIVVGTKGEGPFEVRDERLGPEEIAAVQKELLAEATMHLDDAGRDRDS